MGRDRETERERVYNDSNNHNDNVGKAIVYHPQIYHKRMVYRCIQYKPSPNAIFLGGLYQINMVVWSTRSASSDGFLLVCLNQPSL